MNLRRATIPVLLFTVIASASALATENSDPPGAHRDWGVSWMIRAGGVGGGYGDFLQKGTAWDLDIYKQRGEWRYGLGLMFGSLSYRSPYDDDGQPEWAHFETYGFASRMFRNQESVRPYLQARLAIVRVHPRSTHDPADSWFLKEPVEELSSGESATDAVNGIGVSAIPGVEFDLTRTIALDLSAYANLYITEEYKLEDYLGNRPVDHEDTGTGVEWGGRIGATWRPLSFDQPPRASASPDTTPLAAPSRFKDAWGTTVSPGWAAAEVLAINFGASMFNEYVRQANFNQISPRSFWHNLDEGFTYDDNQFKTNQKVHPFNGSTYFNAGRANGLSYWPSCVSALSGAFIWEAMGETHPMSFNDMVSTGIGGMAYGELTYRLSSLILDNTTTGGGRTWREIGAFVVDPIRGFNRFLSGQASRVQGNPESPYDHVPPHYLASLGMGVRITGTQESISENTDTQALLDFYLSNGSPWDNTRRKPFDHFDTGIQINGDDKVPIGRLQVRGDLFSKAFGGETGHKHALAFVQYFDYVNNDSLEYGAQSFGGALYSRFRPSAKIGIETRADLLFAILAAVNTEYSYVVQTPEQERLREYDYGPGGGLALEATGLLSGRRVLMLMYRAQWINVKNGSTWVPAGNPGTDANHFIQFAGAKVNVPLREAMSLGLDAYVYFRQSLYSREDFVDTNQRIPQGRIYLAFGTSR